jgi:hypothetical protein
MQKLATSKWLKVCLLFFVVTLFLFLGGCGSSKPLPVWNITGSWYTYYATTGTPGEQGPNLFTFTQTEDSLSGTTSQNQQITGTVSGLDITFSWVGSDGATNTSTGKVSADGATMSGTWTSSKGQSGTWHAIPNTSPKVNIAGNWNTYQTTTGTPGEQGPDLFTFTQSGNGLSGTTSQGQQITGTISGLSITFFWTGSDGATYTSTGTVSADGVTMSGTWTGSNGQSGTWRATKIS